MPYDSGGNYSPPSPPIFPAVAGTVVQSGYFNTTITDIGSALTLVAGRVTQLATGPFTGYVGITPLGEVQTASAAQTLFTLATFSYANGLSGAISVFVDGIKLPASDITQTSANSVTIATALVGGEQVEFTTGSFSSVMSGKSTAQHTTTTPADFASFAFRRNVEYSGGIVGNVNGCIRADTYVDNPGAADFQWTVMGILHNNATAGQNVGVYGQGNMLNTGATWGAVAEATDMSYTDSTGKQGLVGLEVDCYINGADVSGNRVGIQIICGDAKFNRGLGAGTVGTANYALIIESQTGGSSQQFINGVVVNSATGAGVVVNTTTPVPQAFRVQNHADIGFDTSLATIGIAAIRIAQGHTIAFNAPGSRQLQYNGTGLLFSNPGGATNYWSWNDDGTLVNGTNQVLGPRRLGWTPMTGSVDIVSVFNTASVSLAQLASRVSAIQIALTAHGLIGA